MEALFSKALFLVATEYPTGMEDHDLFNYCLILELSTCSQLFQWTEFPKQIVTHNAWHLVTQ